MWSFELFPDAASTIAHGVDRLYFWLIALSLFFSLLIATLVIGFAVRYRQRVPGAAPPQIEGNLTLELLWIGIPLVLVLITFTWGAGLYIENARVPAGAQKIYVVGKQWMWKFQHRGGQREINELHVPVGRPVELFMTSEDVIHSCFIPAFRIKMDVLPGRYTSLWFEPTQVGSFHLFCAEYCGTGHSHMVGRVHVLDATQYEEWLARGVSATDLATQGDRLFHATGCVTCHSAESGQRGPDLAGLFGSTVQLRGGATVVADERYLRESILAPAEKVVAGYEPLMPTYRGRLSEEDIFKIIAWIKTLQRRGEERSR